METPFKAMDFRRGDIITKSDMDQMQTNLQWLYEHTPRGLFYTKSGNTTTTGISIACGKVRIPKNAKSDTREVKLSFPRGAFASNCHPHVTTGIEADQQFRIHCVVAGPGGNGVPTNTGGTIKINIAADYEKHDSVLKEFFVTWHAFGFRR